MTVSIPLGKIDFFSSHQQYERAAFEVAFIQSTRCGRILNMKLENGLRKSEKRRMFALDFYTYHLYSPIQKMYLWKFFVFIFFRKRRQDQIFLSLNICYFWNFLMHFIDFLMIKKSTKSRQKVDSYLGKVDEKVDWNFDVKKVDSLRWKSTFVDFCAWDLYKTIYDLTRPKRQPPPFFRILHAFLEFYWFGKIFLATVGPVFDFLEFYDY